MKQNIFIIFFDCLDKETEEHSAEDKVMKNVNMMNLKDKKILSESSQTLKFTDAASLHSLNTSKLTNVSAVQTDLS